jgi:hypothetical protein
MIIEVTREKSGLWTCAPGADPAISAPAGLVFSGKYQCRYNKDKYNTPNLLFDWA